MTTRRDSRRPRKGKTDWAELAAISEEEIEREARSDPDAPPLTAAQIAALRRAPDPKRIRESLGMTQKEFAAAFDLPIGTLRDWEQGRYHPDRASKNFLRLVASDPAGVSRLIGAAASSSGSPRSVSSSRTAVVVRTQRSGAGRITETVEGKSTKSSASSGRVRAVENRPRRSKRRPSPKRSK